MSVYDIRVGDLVQFTPDQWETEEDSAPFRVIAVGEAEYPENYPYIKIEGRSEKYHINLFQPYIEKI